MPAAGWEKRTRGRSTQIHIQAVRSLQAKGTLVEHHARHGQCWGLDVFLAPTPTFFLWKAGGWRTGSQRSSGGVTKRGFPGKTATTASASWDGFPLNLFAWEAQLREIQLAEVPWVASDQLPPLGQRGPGGAFPGSSQGECHGSLERGEKAPRHQAGCLEHSSACP